MIQAQISEIDYYLPEQILSNEKLAELYPEWTAEKIEEKTGITSRHIAAPGETAADMAVKASLQLFASGKCTSDEIDFVILCTQGPDHFLPPSACLIQDRLGIPKTAGAFDFDLGCSGFVYGLAVARGLIETGVARNVLLLTSDTYSKYIHPMDKSVRTLFGDGAAATLIRQVECGDEEAPLIGPFALGTDGSGGKHLIVPAGGMRLPRTSENTVERTDDKNNTRSDDNLYMNGPAIFSFSMMTVPTIIRSLLDKSGLNQADIDLFVFHQANLFMLETLRKQSKIDPERFVIDLADKGNTVSSTVPIALVDAQDTGRLKPNSRVMLVGFGVGLSWGGTLARLPESI